MKTPYTKNSIGDKELIFVDKEEYDRLREALREYGRHANRCRFTYTSYRHGPCNCGWAELEKALGND